MAAVLQPSVFLTLIFMSVFHVGVTECIVTLLLTGSSEEGELSCITSPDCGVIHERSSRVKI